MARNRNINALRQILASDVTAIQTYYQLNHQTMLRDIVGVSSGVITGLEIVSYNDLTVFVPTGSISDGNGKFYELIATGSITLPSTDNTYKIYAATGSTSDTEVNSFELLNTATRNETYTTYNARTYDSITLGYTTGSVPAGAEYLADVVVSGGTITGVTDQRTLITIGSLPAYSLQGFYTNNDNTLTIASEVSAVFGDDSTANTKVLSFTIDNSHNGYGLYGNIGTATGSVGVLIDAEGNTAFKSTLGASATGLEVVGSNQTTNYGIKVDTANVGIDLTACNIGLQHTLAANDIGLNIDGANSGDIGLDIDDVETAIDIAQSSHTSGESNVLINSVIAADALTYYNINSTIQRSGTNIRLDWTNGEATSTYEGLHIENSSGQDALGTAIQINPEGGDYSFATGIKINDTINGIIIDSTYSGEGHGIQIVKDTGSTATSNCGIIIYTASTSVGLFIGADRDASSTDRFGIYMAQTNNGTFEECLHAEDYVVGLSLTNSASSTAVSITGNGTTDKGVDIDGAATAIELVDYTTGISMTNGASDTAISITGASGASNNTDDGIAIVDCHEAIKITMPSVNLANNDVGLYIDGQNSANSQYGIFIKDCDQAIIVTGSGQRAFYNADAVVSLTCNVSTVGSVTTPFDGDIVYEGGGVLKIYDHSTTSWKTFTVS